MSDPDDREMMEREDDAEYKREYKRRGDEIMAGNRQECRRPHRALQRHEARSDMTDDIVDRSALVSAWLNVDDLAHEIATSLSWDEDRARDVAIWAQKRIAFELSNQRQKIEAILEDLLKQPANISRNSALTTVAVVLAAFRQSEKRQLDRRREPSVEREIRLHNLGLRLRSIAREIEALDLSITDWPDLDCKHHYSSEYLMICIADALEGAARGAR